MFNEANQNEFFLLLAKFKFDTHQLSSINETLMISAKEMLEKGRTETSQHLLTMSCIVDSMIDSKIYDTKS